MVAFKVLATQRSDRRHRGFLQGANEWPASDESRWRTGQPCLGQLGTHAACVNGYSGRLLPTCAVMSERGNSDDAIHVAARARLRNG